MTPKTRLFWLTLFTICLFTSAASADTGTAASPFQTIFDDVVHVIATTLSVLLLGVLTFVTNKVRQRFGVTVPNAWLDLVHRWIDQGIAYAEEQAHKASDNLEISSDAKLNLALKFVLTLAGDDKRLVALGEEKIKQMIESRLNMARTSYTYTAIQAPAAPEGVTTGTIETIK